MLFSAPSFFVFFVLYFAAHLAVPKRYRIYLIIVGSTIFYAWWRLEYVFLPYGLTLIAWLGVNMIERAHDGESRRFRLAATLVLLFLPLLVFKYTVFVWREVIGLFVHVPPSAIGAWPLPLGVSFITFTLSAYVIDVYRRVYTGERRLPLLLGYMLFFPHLIAGPIMRPRGLLPQLAYPAPVRGTALTFGLTLFTVVLVKKLVFADPLATFVDVVYAPGAVATGFEYLLVIYAFSAQIYCDFSGYTDMAVGLAALLRVRLPRNFDRPYTAVSPPDFWHRWHITLSRWLRDYLYIPLGGNRDGLAGQMRNVMITMLLGGLWHGAHWTFVVWGGLHGLGIVTTRLVKRAAPGFVIPRWLAIVLTFHFVAVCWIAFRAPDAATAMRVFTGAVTAPLQGFGTQAARYFFELLLLVVFFCLHPFDSTARVRLAVRRVPAVILWPALLLGWILAIVLSQGSSAKFVYFDF
jgi:alginate O-acetyltransferase complex protein AlgI